MKNKKEEEKDLIRTVFKGASLFDMLTDTELNEIVKISREQTFEAGETVFMEGDIAKELYIIEKGKVVLEMSIRLGIGARRQVSIDVLTDGQVFGWSAVAETNTFTMSARCFEKTRVLAIDRAGLWDLFEKDSALGFKVMKKIIGIVSFRLQRSRDTLAHILSIASHDLKSPLASVQSYLMIMQDGYAGETTEKQRRMLQNGIESIHGLLRLIDDILDLSRIHTMEMDFKKISLSSVLEEPVGIAKRLADEKGIKFCVKANGESNFILADPSRLRQVFINLLTNAIKYTPEGGSVTLQLVEEKEDYLVEVIDTGIGVPPTELPKIFDDFYRGKHTESTGAGLGLSIAKKIVEAHNGRIWVESPNPETNTGSTFRFTLPKKSDFPSSRISRNSRE